MAGRGLLRKMAWKHGISTLTLSACLGLAATGAQAASHHKRVVHRTVRDGRIEALESEVQQLVGEVRELKASQQQAAATPATSGQELPAYAAGAPVSGASGVGALAQAGRSPNTSTNPAPSSPDTPSPVTSGGAGGNAGGGALASIVAGKPSITSPDGRFSANLHGVVQFDAADYFQKEARPATVDFRRGAAATDTAHARDLQSGTDFRRARIGIDGKVYGDFEYNVLFDFGGAGAEDAGHVQEAWFQYSGIAPFHLRVGAFRPSLGLEDQGSTNGQPFLERPDSTDVNASLSGGDFREGAELWAATPRFYAAAGVTSRLVGVAPSTTTGPAQSYDQAVGFIGRVAALPLKGDDWLIHVGAHGSFADQISDAGGPDTAAGAVRYGVQFQERPELRVDGTRLISTGGIDASHAYTGGAEVAAQKQNFFIQAEYERYGIERRNSVLNDPDFYGWYVEGSWIITGERRKYNESTYAFDAPPVNHPFDLKHGTFGAFELAARYSDLNLNYDEGFARLAAPTDGVRGGEQRIATMGLDWYLNPVIRFVFEYQNVRVNRLSPNATTFATPAGAQIGQTYNDFAVRSQLAF